MKLSIIIVNYKTPELVINCLESIKNTIHPLISHEIIVVDNHSGDKSEELVLAVFKNIIWINKFENDGFGRANNVGINKSKGEHILLINSDIIVCENAINKSLMKIEEDPTIGVLGCKLLNDDSTLQKSIYYYFADINSQLEKNLLFDYFIKFKKTEIRGIMGAFMLIPRKVLNESGLFDPDFFMYSEEIELCSRIIKLGYRIEYLQEVSAFHKNGASSKSIGTNWTSNQRLISNALLILKTKGILIYIVFFVMGIVNTLTNFCLMWFVGKQYRKEFMQEEKIFYRNFFQYFTLPFKYKRKIGDGTKLLRTN